MAEVNVKYCFDDSGYRQLLYSPLKKCGFIPEKETEIFVSAIPTWISVHELSRFFEVVGELFQVKLMMEPDGTRNRGFGFVTYMNAKLAENAMIQLKNKPLIGTSFLSLQKSVNNCRIFIGGLPTIKTKDEIWQELMSTYNIRNIVDVITYRNYSNPAHNRGFVFLEFRTHEEASYFRAKYTGKLQLFGKPLLVDWSVPILETNENLLAQVKIIFLRNLEVTLGSEDFAHQIYRLTNRNVVEKVYKFKNYAYIHLISRDYAEKLMDKLKCIYQNTAVEVTWAKPPNRFSERRFREKALLSRKSQALIGSVSSSQLSGFLSPRQYSSAVTTISNSPPFINTGSVPKTQENFLPGTINQMDWYLRNMFTDYNSNVASTSYSVESLSEPISTPENFPIPILPKNLTPFHQIQPYYSPESFQMIRPHPRIGSRLNTSATNLIPSGSTAMGRASACESELQDLEAMVTKLVTDF